MKKTNTFFRRMVLMTIACCWAAVGFGQIEIRTAADLKAISNQLDGQYKLMNDITLTENWVPIGTKDDSGNRQTFKGTLDGNGHIIYGLQFNNTGSAEANTGGGRYAGLFGGTENATIKNLGIERANVVGFKQVGVIVGIMKGGIIENCYVTNSYVESEDHVGALVGQMHTSAVVKNCYANAHVYSRSNQAGGLVGVFNNTDTKISECYFSGIVRSRNNRPSGIVTLADHATPTIQNCVVLAPYILGPDNLRIVAASNATILNNYALSSTLMSSNQDNYNGSTPPTNDQNYGKDKRHGANIPDGDAAAKGASFYTTTLGWDFSNTWKFSDDGYPILKWQTGPIDFSILNLSKLYSLKGTEELDFSNLKPNQGVEFTLSTTSPKIEIVGKKVKLVSGTVITSPEDIELTINAVSSNFNCLDKINITLLPAGVIEISTVSQLNYLEVYTEGSYKLTADLDLAGVTFNGLCSTTSPFKGTFDGNGHVIRNFTINNTGRTGVGLINAVDGATIKKLGVEGASVKGNTQTGNIVGRMVNGTLEECYVIDSYAESADHVGALVGTAIGSTIQNSYATSIVRTRDNQAGGLVGVTENTKVSKCFFAGKVSAAGRRANGIVGLVDKNENNQMIVESCVSLAPVLNVGNTENLYRIIDSKSGNKGAVLTNNYALNSMLLGKSGSEDVRTSADPTSVDGADLNVEEALEQHFYETLGWNFEAGSGQWKMLANGYPVLAWQSTPVKTTLLGLDTNFALSEGKYLNLKNSIFSSHGLALNFATSNPNLSLTDGVASIIAGKLTSKDNADVTVNVEATASDFTVTKTVAKVALFPSLIEISTADDLLVMAEYLSGNYKLTADITLTGNWTPVGTFTGTLDGDGYTISGLSYTNNDRDDVGLFSRIDNATIKNLGLENVNFNIGNGKNRLGAIAANMIGGTIEECYVTGSLEGREDVGSLVGIMEQGAVLRNCYSTATKVHATDQEAGGLVGTVRNATVQNSYFAGAASSWRNVSAIVGRADADGGKVEKTVCLSPALSSNENTSFRIINTKGRSVTLADNYSLSTTIVKGAIVEVTDTEYGANKGHGANITGGDEKAKDAAFYTTLGWNFTDVWVFKSGVDYPVLKRFTADDPTSIQPDVTNSQISHSVVNDVLSIRGMEEGSDVAIYSINGQLLSVIKSVSEVDCHLAKGIYVIKVTGEKSKEVIKVLNL